MRPTKAHVPKPKSRGIGLIHIAVGHHPLTDSRQLFNSIHFQLQIKGDNKKHFKRYIGCNYSILRVYSVHFWSILSDCLVIKIFEIFEIPDKFSEQGCRDVRMPPSAVRDIRVMLHSQSHLNSSVVNSTICKCKYEARSTFVRLRAQLLWTLFGSGNVVWAWRVCWILCSRGP